MSDNHLLNNNNVVYGVVVSVYDLNAEDQLTMPGPFLGISNIHTCICSHVSVQFCIYMQF